MLAVNKNFRLHIQICFAALLLHKILNTTIWIFFNFAIPSFWQQKRRLSNFCDLNKDKIQTCKLCVQVYEILNTTIWIFFNFVIPLYKYKLHVQIWNCTVWVRKLLLISEIDFFPRFFQFYLKNFVFPLRLSPIKLHVPQIMETCNLQDPDDYIVAQLVWPLWPVL